MGHKQILLLMGPTGSGKSAMAMEIAGRRPAVIINADAMQMVDALRVLTARPTVTEEAWAEHALYGVLPPQVPTSVARWLAMVEPLVRTAWAEGKLPLIVGGTGMYVKALLDGLARIPEIPAALRERIRSEYPDAADGRLRAVLAKSDPLMAAKLKPGDTQRLPRALEVVEATGKSLDFWQKQTGQGLFPEAAYVAQYIDLPRAESYRRIDRRFEAMMENGALDEVKSLLALGLPADTPILRAHGVPELGAYVRGEMTLEAAIAKAQQHTRNYAKRQMTWIRNQMAWATALPV